MNIARIVKNALFGVAGGCLDLVAVAVPEEARVQAIRKLAMRTAGQREDEVLQALEAIGMVQPCECLRQIRAAIADSAPPDQIKQLATQVDAHDRCERTGFLNTLGAVKLRVVKEGEQAEAPPGVPGGDTDAAPPPPPQGRRGAGPKPRARK